MFQKKTLPLHMVSVSVPTDIIKQYELCDLLNERLQLFNKKKS